MCVAGVWRVCVGWTGGWRSVGGGVVVVGVKGGCWGRWVVGVSRSTENRAYDGTRLHDVLMTRWLRLNPHRASEASTKREALVHTHTHTKPLSPVHVGE